MKRLLLLFVILFFIGCNPVKEIIYKTDYKYINQLQRDTINVHQIDSVLIDKRNDTVFLTKIKYLNKYVEKIKNDTVVINDTIHIDKTVLKDTKKWYDPIKNFLAGIGILTLIFFIFYILLKVLKK